MTEIPEIHISPDEFVRVNRDLLFPQMIESGYRPDAIVGIHLGGVYTAGLLLDEYRAIDYNPLHISIKASSYTQENKQSGVVTLIIEDVFRILRKVPMQNLCFSDEVDETRLTQHGIIYAAQNGLKRNKAEKAYELDGKASLFKSHISCIDLGSPMLPRDAIARGNNGCFVYEFLLDSGHMIRVPMSDEIDSLDANLAFAVTYSKPQLSLIEHTNGVQYFVGEPVIRQLYEDVPWLVFFWDEKDHKRKKEAKREDLVTVSP
jgi:hypoxanthine phosphoribosyltransferase